MADLLEPVQGIRHPHFQFTAAAVGDAAQPIVAAQ
jgi:hypothetical protein